MMGVDMGGKLSRAPTDARRVEARKKGLWALGPVESPCLGRDHSPRRLR